MNIFIAARSYCKHFKIFFMFVAVIKLQLLTIRYISISCIMLSEFVFIIFSSQNGNKIAFFCDSVLFVLSTKHYSEKFYRPRMFFCIWGAYTTTDPGWASWLPFLSELPLSICYHVLCSVTEKSVYWVCLCSVLTLKKKFIYFRDRKRERNIDLLFYLSNPQPRQVRMML